jgi:hypothetical protein
VTPEISETTTSEVVEADSPRSSEDPGDATDDDVRHPDESTEPPDNAESARVRGGEARVQARVSKVSRTSRGRRHDDQVRRCYGCTNRVER